MYILPSYLLLFASPNWDVTVGWLVSLFFKISVSSTSVGCLNALRVHRQKLFRGQNDINLTIKRSWQKSQIKALFSSRKSLDFGIVAHFVVTWQIMSNYGLIKLKKFIVISYFFQLYLMFYACVRTFNVMGTVKKFWELNKA